MIDPPRLAVGIHHQVFRSVHEAQGRCVQCAVFAAQFARRFAGGIGFGKGG